MPRLISTVCQKGKCRLCRYPVCEHDCHGEAAEARKAARLGRRREAREKRLQAREARPELYSREREDEPRQVPFGVGKHPSILRDRETKQVIGIDTTLFDGLEPWWARAMVEGILAEAQRNRRYDGSDKRRAARRNYRTSEKGKAARAEEQRRRRNRLIMGE